MNKKILIIAAHSDDEALGCSGTMAKHIAEGDEVHVLFMTDGVSARGDNNDKKILRRRTAGKKSTEILKLKSAENLNFPDNRMDSLCLLEVTRAIEIKIATIHPDIIYTHHAGDLNVDHQVTHKALMTACRPQPNFCIKEIYAFEVLSSTEWQTPGIVPFTPNVFVDISEFIEIKKQVLECYHEEMRSEPHTRSIKNAIRLNKLRGNSVGLKYAEAFMLIRKIKASEFN